MNFDSMSFGEAVSYVQTIGIFIDLLILSVPVGAVLAIRRGKRNRPASKLIFSRLIVWACFGFLVWLVLYYISGAWYGEDGLPPQTVAAQVTVTFLEVFVGTFAIHVGLYLTTRAVRD